jgi:hemerythrin-like domain-containing protein
MEAYLNKGIKEIIDQFPEVEDILNEYDIGCAPCMVGTCLLKDIVQIHNLNQDDEKEMMAKIAKAIYPDKEIKIPKSEKKKTVKSNKIAYSPPMKKLVDEHVLIKRWVALIPEVIKNLEVESDQGRQLILDGVDFIRAYADKYHHAKEEEILFKYFDEDLDILKVMHADHKQGRSHVQAILEALEIKDKAAIAKHLNAYRVLLTEHIKKEDEILFPWMDKNLSTRQIGELFSKFNETDGQIGYSPSKYEAFIDRMEAKFKQN